MTRLNWVPDPGHLSFIFSYSITVSIPHFSIMANMINKITIAPDPDIYKMQSDSYEPEDWRSETTSIGSSLYKGIMENGRRYQTFVGNILKGKLRGMLLLICLWLWRTSMLIIRIMLLRCWSVLGGGNGLRVFIWCNEIISTICYPISLLLLIVYGSFQRSRYSGDIMRDGGCTGGKSAGYISNAASVADSSPN